MYLGSGEEIGEGDVLHHLGLPGVVWRLGYLRTALTHLVAL